MTQAFNLSQLANNLDSNGRLDATDGLVNAVPIANGGTNASTAAAARANLGAATGTMLNFSFVEESGVLYFEYNGTKIAKLDSSGNFTTLLDSTAYGTM